MRDESVRRYIISTATRYGYVKGIILMRMCTEFLVVHNWIVLIRVHMLRQAVSCRAH